MGFAMIQSLLKIRSSGGQQRYGLEIPEEHREPETAEPDGSENVQDRDGEVNIRDPLREIRLDEHEDVNGVDDHHIDRNRRNGLQVFLDRLPQQQQEGEAEVADQNDQADPAPAAIPALDVPDNFFGQITGPRDQQLGELEIRPEHGDGEQQLAEVMQMFFRQRLTVWRELRQQPEYCDCDGERGEGPADHNHEA